MKLKTLSLVALMVAGGAVVGTSAAPARADNPICTVTGVGWVADVVNTMDQHVWIRCGGVEYRAFVNNGCPSVGWEGARMALSVGEAAMLSKKQVEIGHWGPCNSLNTIKILN